MTQKRTGKHQEFKRQNRKRKNQKGNKLKAIPLSKSSKMKRLLEEPIIYRRRNKYLADCKKYEKKVSI
jgi:hypothetical protein